MTYASFGGNGVGLTAHSVIRDQNGTLFDITPLVDESVRDGMRFIEHDGDARTFFEMKTLGINIHCLDFSATELTGEPFEEAFDEM